MMFEGLSYKEKLQCILDCSGLTKKEIFDTLQPPRFKKVSCVYHIDDIMSCLSALLFFGLTEDEATSYMRKKNVNLDTKSPLKAIKSNKGDIVYKMIKETHGSS